MDTTPLSDIVIVGGGTAGWMTAASLAHRMQHVGVKITLIESSDIGTVGVGEATVPAIRGYFQSLGIDAFELMRATSATFKLGIEFDGWRHDGHRFFHPFARYGITHGPVDFHQMWLKLKAAGDDHPLDEYCLSTQMAYRNRFGEPDPNRRADFEFFDWAVHFDAGLFAKYLRGFAEARGVKRIDARITEVRRDGESGDISEVVLDNGTAVSGELFIDCSGFRSLLMQGALKAGFQDWRHWLPCDRAVAIPCRSDASEPTPYTRARAQTAGWTWRIPLQHRVGNGYVYSSEHISNDEAEATLRAQLDGEAIAPANRIRFTAGRSESFWKHNCVAVGLSAGFLEPLESTSISLIQLAIDKLILLWPTRTIDPRLVGEFNDISTQEYERIRDFIILHYCLNSRHGQPLWDQCRAMAIPDSLRHKIDLWSARGHFVRYNWESFYDPSWLAMYEGFGLIPDTHSAMVNQIPLADLREVTGRIRAGIVAMAQGAPSHAEAIRQTCAISS